MNPYVWVAALAAALLSTWIAVLVGFTMGGDKKEIATYGGRRSSPACW
ncbi:hypothetical protein QFZ82_005205 [Streptomyces sp. V4I23]|nr:hypothetical protein [Streptomyces sp. V4I23]MDQ1010720.1 hypothetical protein [Streptomyces sp. V4I23]